MNTQSSWLLKDRIKEGHLAALIVGEEPGPQPPSSGDGYRIHTFLKEAIGRGALAAQSHDGTPYKGPGWQGVWITNAALRVFIDTDRDVDPLIIAFCAKWEAALMGEMIDRDELPAGDRQEARPKRDGGLRRQARPYWKGLVALFARWERYDATRLDEKATPYKQLDDMVMKAPESAKWRDTLPKEKMRRQAFKQAKEAARAEEWERQSRESTGARV